MLPEDFSEVVEMGFEPGSLGSYPVILSKTTLVQMMLFATS